jgi:hypothetical protein
VGSKAAAVVTPLSPDRYKLQLTISGETLEMLRLAKDMLGHAVPSGDEAAVLERALQALLAELARKKFADTRTPRSSVRTSGVDTGATREAASRNVPANVKRIVWVRDLGRCAFVGPSGHRCNERRFVEFHHVDPYALGGEATVDGIQLRCRHHNDYEGRLYFGPRRRPTELVPEQVVHPLPLTSANEETPAAGSLQRRATLFPVELPAPPPHRTCSGTSAPPRFRATIQDETGQLD